MLIRFLRTENYVELEIDISVGSGLVLVSGLVTNIKSKVLVSIVNKTNNKFKWKRK